MHTEGRPNVKGNDYRNLKVTRFLLLSTEFEPIRYRFILKS